MRQTRDDDVLRDGQTLRVPMSAMDAANRRALDARFGGGGTALRFSDGGPPEMIGHKPGFVTSDALEAMRHTVQAINAAEMRDAWRAPSADKTAHPLRDAPFSPAPVSMADSWRIRSAAYQEMCDEMTNAWRRRA
jgi:hypothetical protein